LARGTEDRKRGIANEDWKVAGGRLVGGRKEFATAGKAIVKAPVIGTTVKMSMTAKIRDDGLCL
jgi:hypothetical protein